MKTGTVDSRMMSLALAEARLALDEGEAPIGAVLAKDGRVICAARNSREREKSALGHAEINVIRAGCRLLGGWRLDGCTLYVTLEPCPMCAGAILSSRIERVVYGARDEKAGCLGSLIDLSKVGFPHTPRLRGGLMEEESAGLLKEFFSLLRGDPGEVIL